eukprot:2039658-Prorocentrum_lima.AAC.1
MQVHPCLSEAVVTFLGTYHDEKPISELRELCGEQFLKWPDYYRDRWAGLDGFGRALPTWIDFVRKVEQTDMPAGLLELEAIAERMHLRIA